MILYPAIDLKDGKCVRLVRGEMDAATVFNDDPAAQARAFQNEGCQWIHLVDLNGAFAGEPVNGSAVDAILAGISVLVSEHTGTPKKLQRHPNPMPPVRNYHWTQRKKVRDIERDNEQIMNQDALAVRIS